MTSIIDLFRKVNFESLSYKAIRNFFETENKLTVLDGDDHNSFEKHRWPKAAGVYVIIEKKNENILYIGMCGKIVGSDAKEPSLNQSKFGDRLARWTPYNFHNKGPKKGFWECGPNFENKNPPKEFSDGSYRFSYKFSDLRIDCYSLDQCWRDFSPSLLEALLLQIYLLENGRLPLANNEF